MHILVHFECGQSLSNGHTAHQSVHRSLSITTKMCMDSLGKIVRGTRVQFANGLAVGQRQLIALLVQIHQNAVAVINAVRWMRGYGGRHSLDGSPNLLAFVQRIAFLLQSLCLCPLSADIFILNIEYSQKS